MDDLVTSRIFVLRHAHSSWAVPGQRDHQRPLDDRGRADVPRLGHEIARAGYRFHVVVCSTATRAVETLAGLRPHLPEGLAERFSDDLYALGAEAYLAAAREQGDAGSVLLVGHNPMVSDFTRLLAPGGDAAALRKAAEGFPTAGLAVIELDAPLSRIAFGEGRLVRLVAPRDLPAD